MSEIRLTKNELRDQQVKLDQLSRYLPTLQLKKAMLQSEVDLVSQKIQEMKIHYQSMKEDMRKFAHLLAENGMSDFFKSLEIDEVHSSSENIAGVEIPVFEKLTFHPIEYSLFATPYWWDALLKLLKELIEEKTKLKFLIDKKELLEEELRLVSIRVNLFEKILIPRTEQNIKKIKVFLGDQQLSAVATSKVAKQKIMKKRYTQRA